MSPSPVLPAENAVFATSVCVDLLVPVILVWPCSTALLDEWTGVGGAGLSLLRDVVLACCSRTSCADEITVSSMRWECFRGGISAGLLPARSGVARWSGAGRDPGRSDEKSEPTLIAVPGRTMFGVWPTADDAKARSALRDVERCVLAITAALKSDPGMKAAV